MSTLKNDNDYKPRIIDRIVDEYLESCGAICIEGPKWCGKTWTSAHHSNSEFLVGDPNKNFLNRELARINPSSVLNGEKPRMIDEWQEVPSLWDAARTLVDKTNEYGNLILTASSTPKTKGILHSGAGRIVSIRMNTMSLYESNDSTGSVSLLDLVNGKFKDSLVEDTSLEKLAYLIIRGGWPKNINSKRPTITTKSYVESILNNDLGDEEGKRFSKDKIEHILKSLARNETTTASYSKIAKDILEVDEKNISKDTVIRYIDELDRIFLFNNQPPYDPNPRSRLRVRGASKRHFCDPSLVCAILNLNEKKLLNDLNMFGLLFEALVERDLSIYAMGIGAKLYHYQNYKDEKIDAIIELDDGNWCAFEIKLAANRIEEGASNLNKVCDSIVKDGAKPPILKAIICGVINAQYKRKDGIYVIPITSLKD